MQIFANRILRPLDLSGYESRQLAGPPSEIVGKFAASSRWLKYIAAILIVLLAAITRLPSPWRMDVTNDEMLHLESYRNHYRSDDISPDLLRQLERARILTAGKIGLCPKTRFSCSSVGILTGHS